MLSSIIGCLYLGRASAVFCLRSAKNELPKMKFIKAASLSLLLCSSASFALPAEVVVIRHGEKPKHSSSAAPGSDQLSQPGCERALALPEFFNQNSVVMAHGAPVAVYAQCPNENRKKDPNSDTGSLRPLQTAAPTAQALGLLINAKFNHHQDSDMVKEILGNASYNDKTVIVAWSTREF